MIFHIQEFLCISTFMQYHPNGCYARTHLVCFILLNLSRWKFIWVAHVHTIWVLITRICFFYQTLTNFEQTLLFQIGHLKTHVTTISVDRVCDREHKPLGPPLIAWVITTKQWSLIKVISKDSRFNLRQF